MNKFIEAVKSLDIGSIKQQIERDLKWLTWSEPDGKNALHYLCGLRIGDDAEKAGRSLRILKFLLSNGMDMNAVQRVDDKGCDHFPATPLWYAYTHGRNKPLYTYLLKRGAEANNCWWAMAWYDDVEAGKLFLKHGAELGKHLDEVFVGSHAWKRYRFADWLLSMGADVNAADPKGLTALILAVKRKDDEQVAKLLAHGADPDLAAKDGLSARDIAGLKGPKRLLKLLDEYRKS